MPRSAMKKEANFDVYKIISCLYALILTPVTWRQNKKSLVTGRKAVMRPLLQYAERMTCQLPLCARENHETDPHGSYTKARG